MTTQGIYLRGEIDYFDLDAVNYSTLKEFAKSPLHYRHRLTAQRSPTKAMQRGTLTHTAILEPDRLPIDFAVFDGERRGNAWKDYKEANAGRDIVTVSEYQVALRMRDAVRSDPVAGPLVAGGHREAAVVWRDAASDILCKGKLDLIRDDHVIVDLKTAACVRHFEFAKAVANQQYHVQAAMYSDGYERVTLKAPRYVIVAVESCEPYDVVVYELGDDVIGPGRDEYSRYLARLKECRETNCWPGYAGGLAMPLQLPKWAVGDEDNDVEALGLEM
jgi:PDDEXK-like domain of unknown function (DUF3799)